MSTKFKVASIGCGAIAQRLHVPDYAVTPGVEIVALCDIDKKKAAALAAKWAPDARIYTDHKKMLAAEEIDGLTVALPNYLHALATIDALNAGCHVNVEKPMAASIEECKKMNAAAKKAGKLLMVNQSQRLFPSHRRAKEVIDSGILGKILHVTAVFGHEGPDKWSPASKWFFDKKQARFGAMADLGVHKADLVRYLTGKEVAEISAYTALLEKPGATVEDNWVSCVKFTDGTVGTICASWTVKGMDTNYTILHCEKGTLRIGDVPGQPVVAELVQPQCRIDFEVTMPQPGYDGSWCIDTGGSFVRACLGEEEPYCTGEEGMKSLAIILAAEKSAQTGKSVKVSL
ncbi:MAG: Gfo/Idh/MocA family oxidoreductase [Candidatus Hydrogenedentes bacterium]|nr:Gfo/Idh/MocA family oxidoreductase [Candidatus Hydrogenedentota bacterium]